jgi:CHAT domain-containing protein
MGARWNYRLANSLNAVQKFEPALAAARLSDDMLQRSGSSPASHVRWMARQQIVRSLLGLERWKEADTAYREFLASMPNDVLARTRASDNRLLAILAAKNGRYDEALKIVERSIRYRARLYGAEHPETQEMLGLRGLIHLLRGDISNAMGDYENLFKATLDTPGGWLDLDVRGVRGFVFGLAFNEYMHYCAERAKKGQPLDSAMSDRALQIADRNAVGVTQRALTDSTARVLAASPTLRNLLEQEQNQRRAESELATELNVILSQEDQIRRDMGTSAYKALKPEERKPTEDLLQQVRDQIKAQRSKMVAARNLLTSRREDVAKQFPSYADLVTPTLPRREQLRALLAPGEGLLVVYPTDHATLVWLINSNGQDGFTASKLLAADMGKRVAELRDMLDLGSSLDDTEPPLNTERLFTFYNELLGPLHAQLGSVRSLLVASNGALASLPFAALVMQPTAASSAPDWLVQHMAVTQIPSPSSLLALRRIAKPTVAAKGMMGFGDPLFKLAVTGDAKLPPTARIRLLLAKPVRTEDTRYDAELGLRYGDIPPLPETRKELQAVAKALGANVNTDLVLGDKATRRAVLEANLTDRRLVAFATHGLMPGELPGVSKPALAMAANADESESPLLELDDVLGLRLNAQWVLLSACNTAAGVQNDAAMTGLVRGFFFAGARSVLATHWAVESDSAAALSAATFTNASRAGAARSESLRQAQLAMLDGTLGGGSWKHPYYWAAYALFGDPVR